MACRGSAERSTSTVITGHNSCKREVTNMSNPPTACQVKGRPQLMPAGTKLRSGRVVPPTTKGPSTPFQVAVDNTDRQGECEDRDGNSQATTPEKTMTKEYEIQKERERQPYPRSGSFTRNGDKGTADGLPEEPYRLLA